MPKLYEFKVEGTGNFPFDMLRYDQCWPKGSESASNLTLLNPIGYTVKRQVTLTGIKFPTIDRWKSFGWQVTSTIAERTVS